MEAINRSSLIKLIEIKHEGIKYVCKIKIIEEDLINISIYLDNELKYQGNIFLEKIQAQVKTFIDYNITEIFEEINHLNINLNVIRNNDDYENLIQEKDNIISELNKKIKSLQLNNENDNIKNNLNNKKANISFVTPIHIKSLSFINNKNEAQPNINNKVKRVKKKI